MKKCSRSNLMVILTALTFNSCTSPSIEILKTTSLSQYPSASALTWANETLYVIGDDATQVLLVNKSHQIKDSIRLVKNYQGRIRKDEKPDFESSFLLDKAGKQYLLALGSFSTPNRCQLGWINLETNRLEKVDTIRLLKTGASSINIEGTTMINKLLVLGNRANTAYPTNQLFLIDWTNETDLSQSKLRNIEIRFPKSDQVVGLSDLHYYAPKDWLLFTASTENTANAYSDGIIGDSYIGVIKNISKKLHRQEIMPDSFQNLKEYLGRNKTYKIEALAIESEEAGNLVLHLAADNDNGKSTLFKLRWKP